MRDIRHRSRAACLAAAAWCLAAALLACGSDGPTGTGGSKAWAAVSGAGAGPCALTSGGVAYCWGYGQYGRLGRGDSASATDTGAHPTPMPVVGNLRFKAISTSVTHVCALTPDGAAYCWGDNIAGSLGVDAADVPASSAPVAVTTSLTFRAIAVGPAHTCAIASDGKAYCWGGGAYGSLGTGLPNDRSFTPLPVTGGLPFTAIAAGTHFTCAVAVGGDAYCWGSNYLGQVGTGIATSEGEWTPRRVAIDRPVTAIAAYNYAACALTIDQDAYCWGWNPDGELGTGEAPDSGNIPHPTPTLVAGGHKFVAITREAYHSCGLATSGDVYCWGEGDGGGLGVDPATLAKNFFGDPVSPVPVRASTILKFRAIAATNRATCGLAAGVTLYCWGYNAWGQLGNGTTESSVAPVQVPNP